MSGAISKYQNFCDGFFSLANQGDGYIIAPVLAVGKDYIKFDNSLLDEINAFDIAEVSSAYLGQINMITVSSFCGPQGLIWGYDIAKADGKVVEYRVSQNYRNTIGDTVPLYSMNPIINATESLFGTKENRIYPIMPGSHVPCVAKQITVSGYEQIYCAIGFGIPSNRRDSAVAIMEDVGSIEKTHTTEAKILEQLAQSILQIGVNQNIAIEEIYLSVKTLQVNKGEVGCALVAVPYFSIAQKALCNQDLENLRDIRLHEWQKLMKGIS